MLFITRPIEILLPMPVALVAVALLLVWRTRRPASRRRAPARFAAGGLLVWAWVLSVPALANIGQRWLEGPPTAPQTRAVVRNPAQWIVVPGSGSPSEDGLGASLDRAGYERMLGAVDLWRRSGGRLLFAGGLDPDPERSIAAIMRRRAIELGVPAEAIRVAPATATTYEDIAAAARIIGEAGGGPTTPVRLVTSASHMRRALAVAHRQGFAPEPWPVDFRQIASPGWRAWLPNNGGPARFATLLHEVVGLVVYRWSGRA